MSPAPLPQPSQDPRGGPSPATGPQGQAREERLWLVLACFLGLIRFWNLGQWSLWIDEAYTLADSYHGVGNYNWPAYALVRWTVEALGDQPSAFSLRFLPALAGWLAIPAAWWALRPWIGGRRAALVALLVALSPWQVYWSQTARFYTLVQLSSLLGAGFVLRGLLRNSIPTACAGLGIAALGAFFHLQAVIVSLALALGPALAWLKLRDRGSSGGSGRQDSDPLPTRVVAALAAFVALVGLVSAPWALEHFHEYMQKKQDPPLASVLHLIRSTAYFVTPALSAAALIGAVVIWRARDVRGTVLLGIVASGAGCLTLAGAFARASAQYGLAFMPFVCALALWVTSMEPLRARRGLRLAVVVVLCAPLLAGLGLYFTTQYGQRPRWQEAYEYVDSLRGDQDLVLGMQAPVGEFYLVPGTTQLRNPQLVRWCDRTRPRAWRSAVKTGRTLWVVVRPAFLTEWEPDDREAFEGFLRDTCRLQRRFPVRQEGRDLDVEVYRRR